MANSRKKHSGDFQAKVKDTDKKEMADRFSTTPPHPEVPAALRKLRIADFRLFTLTDNRLEVQTRQLEHGDIYLRGVSARMA